MLPPVGVGTGAGVVSVVGAGAGVATGLLNTHVLERPFPVSIQCEYDSHTSFESEVQSASGTGGGVGFLDGDDVGAVGEADGAGVGP